MPVVQILLRLVYLRKPSAPNVNWRPHWQLHFSTDALKEPEVGLLISLVNTLTAKVFSMGVSKVELIRKLLVSHYR